MYYGSGQNFVIIGLLLALPLVGCVAQKPTIDSGILMGTTGEYRGNCMPGPGIKPCEAFPVSLVIYISNPSREFDPNQVVDTVKSDLKGHFEVSIPPGTYSLFLDDNGSQVCPQMECTPECICLPITIYSDSTTTINPNLDHAVW